MWNCSFAEDNIIKRHKLSFLNCGFIINDIYELTDISSNDVGHVGAEREEFLS